MRKDEKEDLGGQAEKTLSEIEAVKGQVEKLKESRKAGKISEDAYSELEEDRELIEAGFEYVTERHGAKIYRKQK